MAARIVVVRGSWGRRTDRLTSAVAAILEDEGATLDEVTIPPTGLPRRDRRVFAEFTETPEPLIEAWRAARHIEAATSPGDVVLVPELAAGGGGMFALEQSVLSPAERRRVIVAAGDGDVVQHLVIAGTIDGADPETAHAIDWELVAFRYADLVLTSSIVAASLLADLGVAAVPVGKASAASHAAASDQDEVYVADPPSRIARTGDVLRALSDGERHVVVAEGGSDDRIFVGDTWDALGELRATYGERLTRGGSTDSSVVVVGDPLRLPDSDLEDLRFRARMIVPEGSALAVRWSDAETWREADDLAATVAVDASPPARVSLPPRPELGTAPWDDGRARRVSVAIPVFRDVRFIDECVDSILVQSQPPHEVIIVDDGSRSSQVTTALQDLVSRAPDTVRLVTGPNRGVCVARNLAWEQMTGDAFLFVDADDRLAPEFIARTAQGLRADPAAWAIASWTRFFGSYEGVEARPPFDRRIGLRENPIVSTSVLMAREVRDAGIRFTPDLAFLYCEDWEVWSKIVAAGGSIGLVPQALAEHRVHPSSGGYQRTQLALSLGRARAVAPLLQPTSPLRASRDNRDAAPSP